MKTRFAKEITFAAMSVIFAQAALASEDGQALYLENCASCRGANLEGQENWQVPDENGIRPAPPHDESGHTWHHGDPLLFFYTKLGGEATLAAQGVEGFKSGMPGFGDVLSDDDIFDILAYIRSTWSQEVQAAQAERTKADIARMQAAGDVASE